MTTTPPSLPPDPAKAALDAISTWLAGIDARIPVVEQPPRLAWRRDGLQALYSRLEALKGTDHQLAALADEAHRQLGRAAAWEATMAERVEITVGPDIESRTAMMVNRGMAAEERMIAHRTRAVMAASLQRGFERARLQLEQTTAALRALSFSVRDERSDIRAQLRAIQVGIEISEL